MIVLALVSFIIILSGLVLVHELGHFVAARCFGVDVEEFGLGYPPRAYGVKHGDTTYSLNWIPVGGFVKIKGVLGGDQHDMTADVPSERSFMSKPRWQRLIILSGGILMNCFLSVLLFTTSYVLGARVALDGLPTDARVSDRAITVIDVPETAPAYQAGLRLNDDIIAIDQQPITTITQLRQVVSHHRLGDRVALTVLRGHDTMTISTALVSLTPTPLTLGIGAYFAETGIVRLPVWSALKLGTWQMVQMFVGIFATIVQALTSVFTRQSLAGQIAGPLGIASLTYQATQLGWSYVIQFAAMLSVNLAVFNLLPIPALDGGRLMFLLVEWVRRRPVNQLVETIIHNVGFVLLLALITLVTIKDVIRFF